MGHPGLHPRVLAVSSAATATNRLWQNIPALANNVIAEDQDVRDDIWWDTRDGGTGAGFNINAILPIQLAPQAGIHAPAT